MEVTKTPSIILIVMMFFLFLFTGHAFAQTRVEEPAFSQPAGLYEEEFELTISSATPGVKIYYTLDGSIPVPGNTTTYEYTSPMRIGYQALRETKSIYFCGTVIRAVAISPDGTESKVATASYFVDSNILDRYQLPIISLVTDAANLYDSYEGIMSPFNTQNRGREWEKPVHFEFFDKDGVLKLSMNAGIRLHGGASRDWAFKSFRIYARSEYDEQTQFEYDFFGSSPIPATVDSGDKLGKKIGKFKRLILRNGGNEGTAGDGTLFRDALTQALMVNTTLDLQAYAPAVTFINGEFYGIQNIRERQDEKYIEDHYDVDEKEVVIYEFEYDETGAQVPVIASGEEADLAFYQRLLDFIREKDLSVKDNYEQIKQWIDLENYVDYQIINLYGANRDWPGNNCKAWRVRTEYNPDAPYGLDGRLRFLVYDTDFCFGLYNPRAYYLDSLSDALKVGGTEWPNQDGSTLLFRKLLENEEFRQYFIQRYLDLLNTNFDADYAKALVDKLAGSYKAAIEEFRMRFGLLHDWNRNIETVKEFINKRESICKNFLAKKFDLGKLFFLSIGTVDQGKPLGGKVRVNTVTIDSTANGVKDGVWKKSYYRGIPTMLTAIPAEGYRFVRWSGASDSTEATIDASLLQAEASDVALTPVFEPLTEGEKASETASPTKASIPETKASEELQTEGQTVEKADNGSIYLICILVLVLIILLMAAYFYIRKKQEGKSGK